MASWAQARGARPQVCRVAHLADSARATACAWGL